MPEDSILREVRAAREEYAGLHGFDVRRIVADLQKMDLSGWTVVRLASRPPQVGGATPVLPPQSVSTEINKHAAEM